MINPTDFVQNLQISTVTRTHRNCAKLIVAQHSRTLVSELYKVVKWPIIDSQIGLEVCVSIYLCACGYMWTGSGGGWFEVSGRKEW